MAPRARLGGGAWGRLPRPRTQRRSAGGIGEEDDRSGAGTKLTTPRVATLPVQGLHGVGSHFAPSGSRRKCVLVTNSWVRYFESVTAPVMTSHSCPPGAANR